MSTRVLTAALVTAAMITGATTPAEAIAGLRHARLLGEQVLPKDLTVDGTPVGGLSGLDRDPWTGEWLLLSDDRSARGPARFYRARLQLDARGLHDVRVTGVTPLLRPDGTPYPPGAPDGPDPEALRIDPADRTFYWTSEGERAAPTLLDPFVRQATRDGAHVRELSVPPHLRMSTEERGPRRNATLEGLALSSDGRQLLAAMEGPLHQDGAEPTAEHGALVRFTFLDKRSGRPGRQVAYPVEPVFSDAGPGNNGVVEVLAVDRHHYLAMERAYVRGVGNRVRIYEFDVRGASNTLHRDRLDEAVRPVRKRLLVDLAKLPLYKVDNLEGMAWGPWLPTGERSLVLISDDNFNPAQVTQVVALAVRCGGGAEAGGTRALS
ncbi:esterase-like activity of phytase family protein [Longimycelium tulufanense]|nr:esterase-like activity of phytase family protein [Longimycelium tulufanense]